MVKGISAQWYDLGRELNISLNARDNLQQNIAFSPDTKLEKIIQFWIEGETKPPTRGVLKDALSALGKKNLVKNLPRKRHLSSKNLPSPKSKFTFYMTTCTCTFDVPQFLFVLFSHV